MQLSEDNILNLFFDAVKLKSETIEFSQLFIARLEYMRRNQNIFQIDLDKFGTWSGLGSQMSQT